jgi:hypothetical protein
VLLHDCTRYTGIWSAKPRSVEAWRQGKESFTGKNKSKRKIYLLGSSHGRGIGPMLQENLGSIFDICSIFKPNVPLAYVIEDLGKLGKTLPSRIILL